MSYAAGAALLSLAGARADLNVFMTQPPLFSAWGRRLEAIRRQPYACIVMDLYPWVATEAGVLPRNGGLTTKLEKLSARALRQARSVIVIGRCMAERIESLGVQADRIHIVPNWADIDVVRPVAPRENRLRRVLGLGDAFVVMYSGNMGVAHSFDEVLAAAETLRADPGVAFVFIGDGSRKREVEAAARRLPNVKILGYQPVEELSHSLSLGDVHYVSLRRGFEGLVVPSKAYGAFAAGRPILYQGSDTGEIARVIDEEGVGKVVQPGDGAGLVDGILEMRAETSRRIEAGTRARALAEGRYGKVAGVERYVTALLGA